MSIILIGNGPAILDEELGTTIDYFDTVVRFNNFELKGYEKSVGTKTDIWMTRICETIKDRGPAHYKEVIGVINYCRWTKAIYRILPAFKLKYPEAQIINDTFVKTYSEMFGYKKDENWLSVGMIGVLFFLQQHKEIYLHGFAGDKNKHYFPLNPNGQDHHRFEAEKEVLQLLYKQGKVKFLW